MKKNGRYAEQEVKMHIKAKGRKNPKMKLTFFLPLDVVEKFLPKMKEFVDANKRLHEKNRHKQSHGSVHGKGKEYVKDTETGRLYQVSSTRYPSMNELVSYGEKPKRPAKNKK